MTKALSLEEKLRWKRKKEALKKEQEEKEIVKNFNRNFLRFYKFVCIWECIFCSAEYEQENIPEKCNKCGHFSFKKHLLKKGCID